MIQDLIGAVVTLALLTAAGSCLAGCGGKPDACTVATRIRQYAQTVEQAAVMVETELCSGGEAPE